MSLLLRPLRDRIVRAAYGRMAAARDERGRRLWSERAYVFRRRLYGEAPLIRVAELPAGVRLWVNVTEWEGGNLYFGRPYEPVEGAVVRRLFVDGAAVVDVGANVGVYTVAASRAVGRAGSVHAFEPVSRTFELLHRNVELNALRNVVLERAAVSDTAGIAQVTVNRESGLSSLGATGRGKVVGSEVVTCVTLDAYADAHSLRDVCVLKIDVEGFEGHVLRGARRLLERTRGIAVLAELADRNFSALGLDPGEVIRWMRALGFVAWQVRDGAIAPLANGPREAENVFFARPGTPAAERLAACEGISVRGGAGR